MKVYQRILEKSDAIDGLKGIRMHPEWFHIMKDEIHGTDENGYVTLNLKDGHHELRGIPIEITEKVRTWEVVDLSEEG